VTGAQRINVTNTIAAQKLQGVTGAQRIDVGNASAPFKR